MHKLTNLPDDVEAIVVEPIDETWVVRCSDLDAPLIFDSGACAEEAARRLGRRLSRAGRWAEIRITLRDRTLGGRFICPPESVGSPSSDERPELRS